MKIVLRADVDNLGNKGDLVEVAPGYARNYLVPKGLAMVATDGVDAPGGVHAPLPARSVTGGSRKGRRPPPASWRPSGSRSRPGRARAAGSSARSRRPTSPKRSRPRPASSSTGASSTSSPSRRWARTRCRCASTARSRSRSRSRSSPSNSGPGLDVDIDRGSMIEHTFVLCSARVVPGGDNSPIIHRVMPLPPHKGLTRRCPPRLGRRAGAGTGAGRGGRVVQSISDMRPEPSRPSGGGRVPPHNIEAEESLLGAMLLSKDAIASAVETVQPEDFYKPAHGHLFEAISTLYGAGRAGRPGHRGRGAAPGRPARRPRRQAGHPADPGRHPGGRQRRPLRPDRRGARPAAPPDRRRPARSPRWATTMPDDVTDTLDRAETLVFDVANRRLSTLAAGHLPGAAGEPRPARGAVRARRPDAPASPPASVDLDEVLLGFQPSNLIVVAARPGQGKTSLRPRGGRPRRPRDAASRSCSSPWRWATSSSPSGSWPPRPASTPACCGRAASPRADWTEDQPRRRPPGRGAASTSTTTRT